MFNLDKKTLLNIGAIVAFTFLWYVVAMPIYFRWRARNAPPPQPPTPEVQKEEPAEGEQGPALTEGPPPEGPAPREKKEPEHSELLTAETDEFRFEFSSIGASVEQGWLKSYHLRRGEEASLPVFGVLSRDDAGKLRSFVLRNFRLADLERTNWSFEAPRQVEGGKLVEFATAAGGVEIEKRSFLSQEGFAFDV